MGKILFYAHIQKLTFFLSIDVFFDADFKSAISEFFGRH